MRHYVRSSQASSHVKEMLPAQRYYPEWCNQKLFGRAAVGESVTVKYDGETHTGKIVYIHPKNRYFTIKTCDGIRQSFYFPLPQEREG